MEGTVQDYNNNANSNVIIDEGDNPTQIHIVILHNKFKRRLEDRYIVDMACALQELGHKVTVYTSELDAENCHTEIQKNDGILNVLYCGWWLPSRFKFLRSLLMALRMIFFPPTPQPTIVIMDISPVAMYILSLLTNFKLVYLAHFSVLQNVDVFTRGIKITPDLLSCKALKRAHEIIVPSEGLADVFRRSFPTVRKELRILHPCVDTGFWREDGVDISRIVPDIPKPNFLFVCFGSYQKRSNFKLVLQAFEDLLFISSPNIRNKIHLIIAGHCSESQLEQKIYYKELMDYTKDKSIASQVTFLRQLPTVHKKTLIEECTGVIVPCKHELFPDTILAVMACSRPIIATNTGFAKEALRHRISAILVEPTAQLFAAAMYKVLMNPNIQVFLSDMCHDIFVKNYSNAAFKRKINGIVRHYADLQIGAGEMEAIKPK